MPFAALFFVLSVLLFPSVSPAANPAAYDVVIYAATPAGVSAAVASSQSGLKVVVLEPGNHVGGMMSGGLGSSDMGNFAVIGGLARDFFKEVGRSYGTTYAWMFEPHVAENIFKNWLSFHNVDIVYGQRVVGVAKSGARITEILTDTGLSYSGRVFIDASYEGDLMARAGVGFTYGREGREVYAESLAGQRPPQFSLPLSATDSGGAVSPLVTGTYAGEGVGDDNLMAYNYRLCLTQNAANMVPVAMPPGYDAARYDLVGRYLQAQGAKAALGSFWSPIPLPNGKADVNGVSELSIDYVGGNRGYLQAGYPERATFWEEHRRYIQGLLYFLGNDPQVPAGLRTQMRSWGYAKDEFADTGNWPHQLYVREGRRMIGAAVMTQDDLLTNKRKTSVIGMGSYHIDSHEVQRFKDPAGNVANEGGFFVPLGTVVDEGALGGRFVSGDAAYDIPYEALTPKADECSNLLVPVCLSASHVAVSSLRMEPQYMIMGHAAGVAARLAVRDQVPVQQVQIAELQSVLAGQGQVLTPPAPHPPVGTISINQGAAVTYSPSVQLDLSAADPLSIIGMQISKDGGNSWFALENFKSVRPITLTGGYGSNAICVNYLNMDGQGAVYCTTINLTPPVTGSITINGGAAVSQTSGVTLALSATSVSGTVTQMRFSKDGSNWFPWEPYAATRNATMLPGNGPRSIMVQFMNSDGGVSPTYGASIQVVPLVTGSIVVNGGAAVAQTPVVTLALSAASSNGTITQMRFSKDGWIWYDWEPYKTTRTATLLPGNGLRSIMVQFMDNSGAVSRAYTASIQVVLTFTASVAINGGAALTQTSGVALALSATSLNGAVTQMRFSKDGSNWFAWEPYATTRNATMLPGNGPRSIMVQFMDASGAVSPTYTASIQVASPWTGSISINGGAALAQTPAVALALSSSSTIGPVTRMRFSKDGSNWFAWEPYAATRNATMLPGNGPRSIMVQFMDASGAVSPTYVASIQVISPWTGSISINGGAALAQSSSVTLALSSSSTNGPVTQMRFSKDGSNWFAWEPYRTARNATMLPGSGQRSIMVQFMDGGGAVSPTYTASIQVLP